MHKYVGKNISSSQVDVTCTIQPTSKMHNVLSDMTSFFMKKQLLPECLSNFDDTQESYNAWKLTFMNIISELKVSKFEELDLLLNRLTGNSKLTANGIRNAIPG